MSQTTVNFLLEIDVAGRVRVTLVSEPVKPDGSAELGFFPSLRDAMVIVESQNYVEQQAQ